jgi:DNA-binding Lrp family transcriptional regulator
MHLMDAIDSTLMLFLRVNARMPIALLARKAGVTRATAQARMRRLEEQGIIRGYTVVETSGDDGVRAHVGIKVAPQSQEKVEQALSRMVAVERLYSVSGASDLIAIVSGSSTTALDGALDAIRNLAGVRSTESAILLREKWRRG